MMQILNRKRIVSGCSRSPAGGRLLRIAFMAWATCASQPAPACGFHDQTQVRRGMMNWVYPDSLHVATAVWSAQGAGRLAREELASRDDLAPEARNRLGYLKATRLLGEFSTVLGHAGRDSPRPNLAVVLLGPLLWTRYEAQNEGLRMYVHVDGPARGDVVVVTEAPVIEALISGKVSARDAVALGVIKLYGSSGDARNALEWLSAVSYRRIEGGKR